MKSTVLFSLLLLSGVGLYGQQTCGLYKSIDAFEKRELTMKGACEYGQRSIRVGNFFLSPTIYMKCSSGVQKIPMDSCYAIQDCAGDIYRIWKGQSYLLLEEGEINIYSHHYRVRVKKCCPRMNRYEQKQVTDYYYSIKGRPEVLALTRSNLRASLFTDNESDKLFEEAFPADFTLQEKNATTFKINNYLEQHKK